MVKTLHMASFNQVTLMGNLTRDIELKTTPKGSSIGSFGLAVNRKYTTESGEKKEEVTFIDLTIFGKGADILAKYTKKGNPLFVTGRLKLDSWDDKATGAKRSKLNVIVEDFQLLGSKGDHDDDSRSSAHTPAPSRGAAAPKNEVGNDGPEDDIPF